MADSNDNHDSFSASAQEQREKRLQRRERDRARRASSPKKFDTLAATTSLAKNVSMNDIASLATNQLVTVMVKATIVNAPETVKNRDGNELTKQDCIIADSAGTAKVVLWEQDVGKMKETKSYKLLSVRVKCFKHTNWHLP